ncbi:T9SS type A sorting domain-containing protein [Bacteroidota bacterium]
MKTKIFFICAILLAFAGLEWTQAQDPIPDTVWSVQFNNQIPYDGKFSPDGTLIAHGLDGFIEIRDAETGELIKHFGENWHGGWEATNIGFSPDGKYLFTGGGHNTASKSPFIRMCDFTEDTIFRTFYPDDPTEDMTSIQSLDVSADGIKLAAIILSDNGDWYLCVWEINTGDIIKQIKFENTSIILKFSPDGKYLAITQQECIYLYDASTFEYVAQLKNGCHDQRITDIAFSPDGSLLASVGEDIKFLIHDMESKNTIKSFFYDQNLCCITSLSFNKTGEFLISGGGLDITTKIWKIEDTALVYTYDSDGLSARGIDVNFDNDKILSTGINSVTMLNGKFNAISVPEEPSNIKTIYPNPTNDRVIVIFEQPFPAITKIQIFNETGQEIDTIFEGFLERGSQEITYDCSSLPSSMYIITIRAGNELTGSYKLIKQ